MKLIIILMISITWGCNHNYAKKEIYKEVTTFSDQTTYRMTISSNDGLIEEYIFIDNIRKYKRIYSKKGVLMEECVTTGIDSLFSFNHEINAWVGEISLRQQCFIYDDNGTVEQLTIFSGNDESIFKNPHIERKAIE